MAARRHGVGRRYRKDKISAVKMHRSSQARSNILCQHGLQFFIVHVKVICILEGKHLPQQACSESGQNVEVKVEE